MINSLRLRSTNQANSTQTTTPLLDSLINTNAQVAFKNNDVAKSIEAHVPRKIDDEPHKRKGTLLYLKSSISFGSYAVLICIATVIVLETFFSFIAELPGSQYRENDSHRSVLILTIPILTAISMAFAFVEASNKRLEINFYESEKRRETWEYDNYVEGEQREMVDLYCKKGMANEDAVQVVTLLSKYRDLFIDIMMAEELNLISAELNLTPFYNGIWWKEGLISAWNGIISIVGSRGTVYLLRLTMI
ncbi:hypothetical protein PPL_03351 [Heterostelium album PN500]|uniref:Uncharacterized protein n=1 Tax=Heterostelium pallidum (strain ATCC 26659 / Pp 5 / PN500) TaxID=670386 RepID=D3B4M6_HETP5|nr:hypothetical protein PPL_03351 [Heterostelium album PN500]EFA84274.1 hypothetical protein PPL_03351 [Heterostelium album PN500]|eukprot:XP_020436390.1 hypothetical protein PPL_03351 [Heterostelium album PN500]